MKTLFAACIAIVSLPLYASNVVSLQQSLDQCRAEQNPQRRLSCYDAIHSAPAQANNTAAKTLPAQANAKAKAAVNATPAVNAKASEEFGLEHKPKVDEAEKLSVSVKSVSYSLRKELIVEFDNGQRWRQIGNEHYSIAVGQQHYIKRGSFNSFMLANDNNNRTIRIRREQ